MQTAKLGDAIFADIDKNPYLNELYDNILFNYSLGVLRLLYANARHATRRIVDVEAALRFADLLSRSKQDRHKIWAQEIAALLLSTEQGHPMVEYFLGSVLSNVGNYRGMAHVKTAYQNRNLLDGLYGELVRDYMSIPADREKQFFRTQKQVYDHLSEQYFSFSGPTSMGKSFIMRMFIKEQVTSGMKMNFCVVVPTKALINEVQHKLIADLDKLLEQQDYTIVTSGNSLALEKKQKYIFVLTPERLLYLLIEKKNIHIDLLFVDEAHKISAYDSRSTFYYQDIALLSERSRKPRVVFSSPNIPNPEIYLKLIPDIMEQGAKSLATSYSPVSQVKYIVDFQTQTLSQFNSVNGTSTQILSINGLTFCGLVSKLSQAKPDGRKPQSVIYSNSTAKVVHLAQEYADRFQPLNNAVLERLAKDIENEVHADYYLAQVVRKGIAYHIGYLPSALRARIEEQFCEGNIHTLFCTSTLVEGVNLPADNLFITSQYNGRKKLTNVDFLNLVGRVGRIEFNLYGNAFLVRLVDDKQTSSQQYEKLLSEPVPPQKLSVVSALTKPQKKRIIAALEAGTPYFKKEVSSDTEEDLKIMRKFALILLRDIIKDRKSLVRREFTQHMGADSEDTIKARFSNNAPLIDDDINISVDQTIRLRKAISEGLEYPSIVKDDNLYIDGNKVIEFLEKLCEIFLWEKCEASNFRGLGKRSKNNGGHSNLRWYAVILSQWIRGNGLQLIMTSALRHKANEQNAIIYINNQPIDYDRNSLMHRNVVISDTLNAIENVILFSLSNYFLRFSEEYKRQHGGKPFDNDWYEFVEYGTTNTLSIFFQRNGISRETSDYIKNHREYIVNINGEIRLKSTLATCGSVSVENEVKDLILNISSLFIDG